MKEQPGTQKNEKAEEILDVAFELFSSSDYADVSVKDIAQRVNSTYSLVYYYYNSKSELFHSCVKRALKKAISSYQMIDGANATPVEAINMWLDLNIKQSKDLKKICRIMLESSNRRSGSPSVEWYIRYFYKFEKTILQNGIRRGVEMGIFKCDRPDELAAFISSGIDGIFYGALTRPGFDIRKSVEILRSNIWILLQCKNAVDFESKKIGN